MGRRKCRIRKQWVQKKAPAPAASPSPPPPPPWIELPGDVTANILQRLGAEAMLRSAQQVCRTWWKVCKDPAMWRVIDLCNIDDMNMFEDYNAMCRRAVDRSQGQLVHLTIDFFGDGELIIYVADRSRNLKRLKLVSCDEMSADPLIQAVEKLEQLEELHLIMFPWIEAHHIEAIGHSCPKLKSFSYNERGSKIRLMPDSEEDDYYSEGFDRNTYARAIGKCMPNLHHLQLFAHEEMQNEGLEAILDGCPRLESLDIRQCYGLDLVGDLGKRCREQIKDLRLPNDSVSDVPWLVGEPSELDFERYSDCYDDNSYYGDFEYEYYDDYFSPLGYGSFNDDFSPRGYGFFNDDGPGIFDYDFF